MNGTTRDSRPSSRLAVRIAAAATVSSIGILSTVGGQASAAPGVAVGAATATSTPLVQKVVYQGRTLTLRMNPVTVRAATYQVLVQQPDGSLSPYTAAAAHAYLGSVDGDAGAVAEGIINSDGVFVGQVVFDRGGTVYINRNDTVPGTANTVTGSRSMTQPTSYKWPSATDQSLNHSVTAGQAGSTSREWDLGLDLDNGYFTSAPISGSLAKAVDEIDLKAVSLLGVYETDLEVHPMVAKVIIRASAANDPYAGLNQGGRLGKVVSEWNTNKYSTGLDDVAVLTNRDAGSGVAYESTAGNPGFADAGGTGPLNTVVLRHEFGHTWGAYDNHTNGPEGATIQSGNGYDRWDGTELRSMLNYRNAHLSKFNNLGTFIAPLPPYAALDLLDQQISTVPFTLNPLVNDYDVNGHPLAVVALSGHSSLGGAISRSGNVVTYIPPRVSTAQTIDWAEYVVRDTVTGKTATGVMEFRIDPYVAPAPSSTWPKQTPATATAYQLTNRQSGLVASTVGRARAVTLVQRAGTDKGTQWSIRPSGGGVQMRNLANGLCADVYGARLVSGTPVIQYPCNGHTSQQWRIVKNPAGAQSLISVRSGLCLAVHGASINSGAQLMQTRCGLSTATIWSVDLTPMSTWSAYVPPTTANHELVNAGTGLHVGSVVGASYSANFIQEAAAKETALNFVANPDGTWQVKQASSHLCFNDASGYHADVVLWTCSTGSGDAFRFVNDPKGGVMIVGVLGGRCVGINGASTASGAKIEFETCNTADETQRWNVAASVA